MQIANGMDVTTKVLIGLDSGFQCYDNSTMRAFILIITILTAYNKGI